MSVARFVASQRIAAFFGEPIVLPEETDLVMWSPGMEQRLHRDVSRETTRYSAIIYLNDAFQGGETVFPGVGLLKPVTGAMVAFEGVTREHGVAKVRGGTRYTMAMWFTDQWRALEF